jgi:dihydroorotate dehydrogenase (NAD+) catalytic subunit
MSLMLQQPFYDPLKTYEENYSMGPFGAFSDGTVYEESGEPTYDFLGVKVYTPFGIPAGPLINSRFLKGAFEKGFDVNVYKTVRSSLFPCHLFPNVLALHPEGKLNASGNKLVADNTYEEPLTITNSFGVPSKEPDFWQADVKKAMSYAKKGQLLILSFMGTVREKQSPDEFVADFAEAAKLSAETGAKALEVNLSCPNIGNEGLVCYNTEVTKKALKAIRNVIGNTPLLVKVGYYEDEKQLETIAGIINEYAQGVAAINTIQSEIVDAEGNQALPGKNRLRSGVCGAGIKWAGLDMVTRLKKIKDDKKYSYAIVGMGGVMSAQDYMEYRNAGADVVMSATGAMWKPYLGQEIKKLPL